MRIPQPLLSAVVLALFSYSFKAFADGNVNTNTPSESWRYFSMAFGPQVVFSSFATPESLVSAIRSTEEEVSGSSEFGCSTYNTGQEIAKK